MNWPHLVAAFFLGALLGAVLQTADGDLSPAVHRTSAARFGLAGHEQAGVCRSLVRAGVLVSCTYEGEK